MLKNAIIFIHSPWSGPSLQRRALFIRQLSDCPPSLQRNAAVLVNSDAGTGHPVLDSVTNGWGEVVVTDADGSVRKVYGKNDDFTEAFGLPPN